MDEDGEAGGEQRRQPEQRRAAARAGVPARPPASLVVDDDTQRRPTLLDLRQKSSKPQQARLHGRMDTPDREFEAPNVVRLALGAKRLR